MNTYKILDAFSQAKPTYCSGELIQANSEREAIAKWCSLHGYRVNLIAVLA